jgi:APA family basic amino acid/polyamine antiporter
MVASAAKPGGLRKVLGPTDLILMGIGAIIGTGIFVLTGAGALTAGPALTVSFIVAAIACGFAAMCYAEFASTVPVAGSIYTYSYATLGEIVAWMIGWDLLLEYGLATSTVASGWSGYFQSLLSGFGIHIPQALSAAPGALQGVDTVMNLPALCIMLLLTFMLSLGVRESARVNNVMVVIKTIVVLLFIVVGVKHVAPANWTPFAPFGVNGIMSAAAVVFFAFIGFDAVTSAAEEVKRPERDLPIGIIGSLLICTVLYVIVAAIMTGIVPFQLFKGVDHPVSLALQHAGENWFAGWIDLGAILGMTTVILVMAYGQTRIIYAMSRDGLLPAKLSTVHPKYGTPFFATWIVGIVFGRVLPGLGGRDRAAQEASGPEARLPLPGRADRARHRRRVLPGADVLPVADHLDRLRHLAADRPRGVFRLRAFALEAEQGGVKNKVRAAPPHDDWKGGSVPPFLHFATRH